MPLDIAARIDALLLSPLAREVRRRNRTYLPLFRPPSCARWTAT